MKKFKYVIFSIFLIVFFTTLSVNADKQPTKKQLEAFRSAKTVKIIVEQSYGEAKDVNLPVEAKVQSIVKYIGLKRVTSDVKDCDVTIKIKVKGKALSRNYVPGGLAYTGASFSGSISLKAQGVQAYQLSFKSKEEPPRALLLAVISSSKSPSDAPFSACFYKLDEGSFIPTIAGIMKEVYGVFWCLNVFKDEGAGNLKTIANEMLGKAKDPKTVEPLISLLKDKEITIRMYAIITLGYIRDHRAIEPLIEALMKEDNSYLREELAEALKTIIGQDFGQDQEKWQKWWEENKDKYLKKK